MRAIGSIARAKSATARGQLFPGAVLGLLILVLFSGPQDAQAAVQPFEVREFQRDFGVSAQHAEKVLRIQSKAGQADLLDALEEGLGEGFAGAWFKPESGEYIVPMASTAVGPAVGKEMAAARLDDHYRTLVVKHSWEELEAAQDELDKTLAQFFEAGLVYTSLDPRTNAAVLHVAAETSGSDRAVLNRIAKEVGGEVELRDDTEDRFEIKSHACNPNGFTHCGTPFRGGVSIDRWGGSPYNGWCTAGFRALGGNGKRYVITAAHCVLRDIFNPDFNDPVRYWQAWDEQSLPGTFIGQPKYLGQVEQISPFPSYDWTKIDATGTEWDTWNTPQGWPSMVAYWQKENVPPAIDEEYDINWEARSITGQTVCHSGLATGSTCGQVVETDVSKLREGGVGHDLVKVKGTCNWAGDSGGPWFFANTAYGIHNAGDGLNSPCEGHAYYQEITDATAALNVSVAPRVPKVTISASPLNGNPGWVTLKGNVTIPNVAINSKTIEVKLFKWNTSTSDWDEKATLKNIPVNNSSYEFKNWEGVGPGTWIAKAIFPAQGGLAGATSDEAVEGSFEVKDGYQLISTVSNKCADVQYSSLENGAPVWQFGCWSPVRAGQVFWIKPISGPYVQLINKNSKKCMETRNVSQTAGETMQQWSCGWLAQESQLWQKVDVAGGSKFVVKHSGQCLDLYLSGTQDGNKIDQHPCNGTNAQVWQVKSVNSEPAKPEVFLTISGVQPGQPGFFDISGNVKQGDYPVNGKPVFIDFERLVGSVWQKEPGLTKEVKADSTGYYVLVNNFVGRGTYRAHARLNSELPLLGGAESGNHQFQIGMGYRLASKLAPNKCLSVNNGSWNQGAPILLWDCSPNPQGGDGQVITWSPVNGIWPHRQIVFNGSKLCLDVPGVKQDDGLQLQQWACNVAGQDNQLWTGSGGEYQEFRVKHSGKCIDLWFSGTQNGNKIDQHACNGTNAQKWKFQYIP